MAAIVRTQPAHGHDRYLVRPDARRDGVLWEVFDVTTHRTVAVFRVKANAIRDAHKRNLGEKGGRR